MADRKESGRVEFQKSLTTSNFQSLATNVKPNQPLPVPAPATPPPQNTNSSKK